jgi:hypothetical protein
MEILYIIGGLVLLFIVWTAIGTARKMRATDHIAGNLSPQAKQQFIFWDTEYNKSLALGRARDAKINRAKSLVVAATNTPISDMVSGNLPLLCQPGHIDGLPDEELDELLERLSEIQPGSIG